MPRNTRRRTSVRRKTIRKKGGFTPLKLDRYRQIIQSISSSAAFDNLYDDVMASLFRDNRMKEAIQFYGELTRDNQMEPVISYPFKHGERTHLPFFKNFITFAKTIKKPFTCRIRQCILTEDAATLLSNFIASDQCTIRRLYIRDVKMNGQTMAILADGIRNNRSMIELSVELSRDQDEQESSACMYALSRAFIDQPSIKQVSVSCSRCDFKGWGEVIGNNRTLVALTIEYHSETAPTDDAIVDELADGLHKNTTLISLGISGPKLESEQLKRIFISIITNKESGLYNLSVKYTQDGGTYMMYLKNEFDKAMKELQDSEREKTRKVLNEIKDLPTNISKLITSYTNVNIPTKLRI